MTIFDSLASEIFSRKVSLPALSTPVNCPHIGYACDLFEEALLMKSVLLKAGMTPSYIIDTGLTNACLACSPLNFEVWPHFLCCKIMFEII